MDMETKQEDGSSLKVHLEKTLASPFASVERIEEAKLALKGVPFPVLGSYLIDLWKRAQPSRESGGMGVNPINYRVWARERLLRLDGYEIEALEALDTLVARKKAEQDSKHLKETHTK